MLSWRDAEPFTPVEQSTSEGAKPAEHLVSEALLRRPLVPWKHHPRRNEALGRNEVALRYNHALCGFFLIVF